MTTKKTVLIVGAGFIDNIVYMRVQWTSKRDFSDIIKQKLLEGLLRTCIMKLMVHSIITNALKSITEQIQDSSNKPYDGW